MVTTTITTTTRQRYLPQHVSTWKRFGRPQTFPRPRIFPNVSPVDRVSTGSHRKWFSNTKTFPRGTMCPRGNVWKKLMHPRCAPVETFWSASTWKRFGMRLRGNVFRRSKTFPRPVNASARLLPRRFRCPGGVRHTRGNVFTGSHCPDVSTG